MQGCVLWGWCRIWGASGTCGAPRAAVTMHPRPPGQTLCLYCTPSHAVHAGKARSGAPHPRPHQVSALRCVAPGCPCSYVSMPRAGTAQGVAKPSCPPGGAPRRGGLWPPLATPETAGRGPQGSTGARSTWAPCSPETRTGPQRSWVRSRGEGRHADDRQGHRPVTEPRCPACPSAPLPTL